MSQLQKEKGESGKSPYIDPSPPSGEDYPERSINQSWWELTGIPCTFSSIYGKDVAYKIMAEYVGPFAIFNGMWQIILISQVSDYFQIANIPNSIFLIF